MKKKIIIGTLLLASFLTQAQTQFNTPPFSHRALSIQGNTFVIVLDTVSMIPIQYGDCSDGLVVNLDPMESIRIGFQDSYNTDTDGLYRRKVTFYCHNGNIDTYYLYTENWDYTIDGDSIDFLTVSIPTKEYLTIDFCDMNDTGYGLYNRTTHVITEDGVLWYTDNNKENQSR